jgi:hypothetical protein
LRQQELEGVPSPGRKREGLVVLFVKTQVRTWGVQRAREGDEGYKLQGCELDVGSKKEKVNVGVVKVESSGEHEE